MNSAALPRLGDAGNGPRRRPRGRGHGETGDRVGRRYCPGCTGFTKNVTDLADLTDSGVTWVTVSDMPLAQIEAYKAQMGWTLPFVSSHGTSFSADCGASNGFMLSVFLRDGTDVYRTYCTTARGVDRLIFVTNVLDLCPYGRQEDWEDSPPGWPQRPTYTDEQVELLERITSGQGG